MWARGEGKRVHEFLLAIRGVNKSLIQFSPLLIDHSVSKVTRHCRWDATSQHPKVLESFLINGLTTPRPCRWERLHPGSILL